MDKPTVSYYQQQVEVNAYFQAESSYWKEVYAGKNLYAEIYRARRDAALSWVDELGLAAGSRVLEIGCGAGLLSVALAQRGLRVQAIDSTEAMVDLARRHAKEAGMSDQLSVEVGDVYALAFEDEAFDLVLAIGVISWLARPELAMQEMARISKPGGHVLLTDGNQAALNLLLDPWMSPTLAPLRRGVKGILERVGFLRRSPKPLMAALHDRRFIDETLVGVGLIKTRSMTVGFGPFTFLRRKVLSESLGIALHHRLQRLAERNVPLFRSTGMSYLVLGSKLTVSRPVERSTSA